MAFRRKHGNPRASSFEDSRSASESSSSSSSSSSSLAAQAIWASSAHRDSSLSSAYGESAFATVYREPNLQRPSPSAQDSNTHEYTSMKSLNESKYGFWGVLARKAKSILDDDNVAQQFETHERNRPQMLDTSKGAQSHQSYRSPESYRNTESPTFQKGLGAITSSLNHIGGAIGNALEEGLTIVENRTADIIQETRKLHTRRKGSSSNGQNQAANVLAPHNLPHIETHYETQLKASRDVANAMAAKAKLLLRELKTFKADLAFAKERCAQLEEENKILRESREKGDSPEDDDLIRLQLETLLAEKARLAHENSIYARENRFLREIVEYHQLTMQDLVYLDEGTEEVTEVCPIKAIPSPASPAPVVPEALSPVISTPTLPPPLTTSIIAPETCSIVPISPIPPPQLVSEALNTKPSLFSIPTAGEKDAEG